MPPLAASPWQAEHFSAKNLGALRRRAAAWRQIGAVRQNRDIPLLDVALGQRFAETRILRGGHPGGERKGENGRSEDPRHRHV
jgi:hypothetical protein